MGEQDKYSDGHALAVRSEQGLKERKAKLRKGPRPLTNDEIRIKQKRKAQKAAAKAKQRRAQESFKDEVEEKTKQSSLGDF